MLYYTVLWGNVMFYTVLCRSILFFVVLYCYMLFYTVLCCTVLYCGVLFYSVLCCTLLFNSVLCCSMLYFTVLCCTVMFYKSLLFVYIAPNVNIVPIIRNENKHCKVGICPQLPNKHIEKVNRKPRNKNHSKLELSNSELNWKTGSLCHTFSFSSL